MKLCFFGFYRHDYSRNRILLRGLRAQGVEVIECHTTARGVMKYIDLIRKHYAVRDAYDVLFVAYPGYMPALLARMLTRKPIVYDAFFSIYDSVVNDRQTVRVGSVAGWYYWWIDRLACMAADVVLLDTNANIEYFVRTFKIPRSKFSRLLIGSDESAIFPEPTDRTGPFRVHFHGGYNPMQGAEYIVEAASRLRDEPVVFQMVGRGQMFREVEALARQLDLRNIEFTPKVAYEELRAYMNRADICLGIFADTLKADRVIPNKAYEAISVSKVLVTRDSTAMRELFVDRKHCVFVKAADPDDLAQKIRMLFRDQVMRDQIAHEGYALFQNHLTTACIGGDLKDIVQELLKKHHVV
ncbi:MAG: hypothetical protein A2408_02600 [Candidatus Yonathbacteria bacterium RIFOXYC1_FULL_52_10]|uniref:Glycosyl transferase family 1 domain-containing protein n=1 Tax=Candidatus Yonathbacteria bacterium RIFOXYD1_FULL_52_36 TaxID=1802730 RepID=A0A1G2SKX3_9BACT|nr:MAG: hypothetical protein A2408_02600 [Candidatus Yonathbacteria bacterium RIFOXYC1_FULL_52_10]OHA85674.1 MAG: hypothetical protein A2591_02470 [Candidatus Yonathbacteria bacterium RIFOXYD1_FULL_52_36]